MKTNLPVLGTAVLGGAALTPLLFVLVTYSYGNQPTALEMELAAELGGGIGGILILIAGRGRPKKPPLR